MTTEERILAVAEAQADYLAEVLRSWEGSIARAQRSCSHGHLSEPIAIGPAQECTHECRDCGADVDCGHKVGRCGRIRVGNCSSYAPECFHPWRTQPMPTLVQP